MRILALEPYYGGSHRDFLDTLTTIPGQEWTVLSLDAHKWKWRMRHAAVTFAQQLSTVPGQNWDLLFCSDMLNLAEFIGLAGPAIQKLPAVAYFHENQLTYPQRFESQRDYQFVMTNMTTALAGREVWFNSAFHRDDFLDSLGRFLRRMPDYQPTEAVDIIAGKSRVLHPAVDEPTVRNLQKPGPLRILWAARWEHDKNPEDFFAAMEILAQRGCDFRLSVLGQHFRQVPEVFAWAKKRFQSHIDHWGYQPSRQDYQSALAGADVVVSTAMHEFFGISVVEAILAGAYPLLPNRLAYPELLQLDNRRDSKKYFYNGSAGQLAKKLADLCRLKTSSKTLLAQQRSAAEIVSRFKWQNLQEQYQRALQNIKPAF